MSAPGRVQSAKRRPASGHLYRLPSQQNEQRKDKGQDSQQTRADDTSGIEV